MERERERFWSGETKKKKETRRAAFSLETNTRLRRGGFPFERKQNIGARGPRFAAGLFASSSAFLKEEQTKPSHPSVLVLAGGRRLSPFWEGGELSGRKKKKKKGVGVFSCFLKRRERESEKKSLLRTKEGRDLMFFAPPHVLVISRLDAKLLPPPPDLGGRKRKRRERVCG